MTNNDPTRKADPTSTVSPAPSEADRESDKAESSPVEENAVPRKKPVPKWEGESTKIQDKGRAETSKSKLPFSIFLGATILKRDVFIFTLIALAIFLSAAVPTTVWMLDMRKARLAAYEEELSGKAEEQDTGLYRPAPNQMNIHNLMQWHIAASKADRLKSYQIRGAATILDEQSETQFALLGLPPGHYRQDSWSDWKYRVSTRFNAGKISHEVTSDAISLLLNDLEEAILWIESSFGYLAQTYLAEQKAMAENEFDLSKLRFVKITDFEGKRCAVIESRSPLGFPVLHYIDYETGLESRRTAIIKSEGSSHAVEMVYFNEDPGRVIERDEPPLPTGYLLEVDGKPKYSVKFKESRINPGLTEALFAINPENPYGN